MGKRAICESKATPNSFASSSLVSRLAADLEPRRCGHSFSFARRRFLLSQELYRRPNTLTPYGPICQETIANRKDGPIDIYFASPFALLYTACEKHKKFAIMLESMLRSSPDGLDIAYYLDKARPGNPLMPADGRLAQCLYWTLLQFPNWWLSRCNGWIPFAYILVTDQKQANLTDSMLVRWMVGVFDSDASDLAWTKGFLVPSTDG